MATSETDPAEASAPAAAITYADSGVNIAAGNQLVDAIKPLAAATRRPGAEANLGGFGALFDLKRCGLQDPILVAATDGVGTKLKIAIESERHDTVGVDLVAMCVNDLLAQGAEPLFFLDYYACGKLDVATARSVIAGVASGCLEAGCALIGGETAEMPGMYCAADYDLAGFAVGAVERDQTLPRRDITAGDLLIGLPSSGLHSNGFSLVRQLVSQTGLGWSDPAPFAVMHAAQSAQPASLREAVMVPTRIYVKPVLATLRATAAVKAIAHITGGGLTENLPRVLSAGLAPHVDLASWRLPPVFDWLRAVGRLDAQEMLRTFNCGIGLVLVVDQTAADTVCDHLRSEGESPCVIGAIEPGAGLATAAKGVEAANAVRYSGDLG